MALLNEAERTGTQSSSPGFSPNLCKSCPDLGRISDLEVKQSCPANHRWRVIGLFIPPRQRSSSPLGSVALPHLSTQIDLARNYSWRRGFLGGERRLNRRAHV